MEENGKDYRSVASAPLWMYLSRGDKHMISLNLPKFLLGLTCLLLLQLSILLFLVCKARFDCKVLIPSLSYVTTFQGFDRLGILVCTGYSGVLFLINIGAYARFKGTFPIEIRDLLYWTGVAASVLFPLLPTFNEVNVPFLVNLERIQAFCYYTFLFIFGMWTVGTVICLEKMTGNMNAGEMLWMERLRWSVKGICALSVLMAVQWKFSYTTQAGWLLNETALGATGWITTGLGLFIPAIISQLFRGFNLLIPLHDSLEKSVSITPEA